MLYLIINKKKKKKKKKKRKKKKIVLRTGIKRVDVKTISKGRNSDTDSNDFYSHGVFINE